jgi:hypothetical protein
VCLDLPGPLHFPVRIIGVPSWHFPAFINNCASVCLPTERQQLETKGWKGRDPAATLPRRPGGPLPGPLWVTGHGNGPPGPVLAWWPYGICNGPLGPAMAGSCPHPPLLQAPPFNVPPGRRSQPAARPGRGLAGQQSLFRPTGTTRPCN